MLKGRGGEVWRTSAISWSRNVSSCTCCSSLSLSCVKQRSHVYHTPKTILTSRDAAMAAFI